MITFCIPSKNNLRYLKACIPSIQQNSYYKDNEIIVYVDQDHDGTVKWLEENKIRCIKNPDSEPKGIGHAYDLMFKAAKHDLVVAFHADMILGPDADFHLVKHYKRKSVVCATRIEPPLHPPGPEKVVRDFGMWPEEIKWEEFNSFVKQQTESKLDTVTSSTFAPWLIHREDHLGHDPIFLSVFEDADLFRRFKLAGYETIQSWSSYVYHLTCRGGQFEHAKNNEDFRYKSSEWQRKNEISLREYIRKWGGMFKEYGPCEPRPNVKYNVGARIVNCTEQLLSYEPFIDQLSVDCDYEGYLKNLEGKTSFDVRGKFVKDLDTDIIIEVDASDAANIGHFSHILLNLEDTVQQVEADSTYEFDAVRIIVKEKTPVQVVINLQ